METGWRHTDKYVQREFERIYASIKKAQEAAPAQQVQQPVAPSAGDSGSTSIVNNNITNINAYCYEGRWKCYESELLGDEYKLNDDSGTIIKLPFGTLTDPTCIDDGEGWLANGVFLPQVSGSYQITVGIETDVMINNSDELVFQLEIWKNNVFYSYIDKVIIDELLLSGKADWMQWTGGSDEVYFNGTTDWIDTRINVYYSGSDPAQIVAMRGYIAIHWCCKSEGNGSGNHDDDDDENIYMPYRATRIGQIMYSIDGYNFERALPVTSHNDGVLITREGIILVQG